MFPSNGNVKCLNIESVKFLLICLHIIKKNRIAPKSSQNAPNHVMSIHPGARITANSRHIIYIKVKTSAFSHIPASFKPASPKLISSITRESIALPKRKTLISRWLHRRHRHHQHSASSVFSKQGKEEKKVKRYQKIMIGLISHGKLQTEISSCGSSSSSIRSAGCFFPPSSHSRTEKLWWVLNLRGSPLSSMPFFPHFHVGLDNYFRIKSIFFQMSNDNSFENGDEISRSVRIAYI